MENPYIYGMHEPPPMTWLVNHMMVGGRAAGWIVHTHELGHDPTVRNGFDYTPWANPGWGQIARLNNGYGPAGTIPLDPAEYDGFAARCAWWVANSQGCERWIVGNEPNGKVEGLIRVEDYATAFEKCYTAIKAVQPESVIMPAPVAMWNAEKWDWLAYYSDLLKACWPFDAIAWHTYTHGSEPELIRDMTTMAPPYQDRLYNFRAYWDLWEATPEKCRELPVYITETDQGDVASERNPWLDEPGVSWIQEAYAEIDRFNEANGYPIRCLACYRWPQYDEWYIDGKAWVHLDFEEAVQEGYTWRKEDPPVTGEWTVVFSTTMDEGFYDYEGIGELTVPKPTVPLHEHDGNPETALATPEYDERHAPHVHTEPNAAGFFSMYSTMEAALVWRVDVEPGDEVRASIWSMVVDGGGGPQTRLGLATEDPGEGAIEVEAVDGKFAGVLEARAQWGDWQEHSKDIYGLLWSPVVVATGAHVWVMANGRQDWANPGHIHFDDLVVEVRRSGGSSPGTGEHTIRVETYFDDHLVSSSVARVDCADEVNAQVCDLAQQIVGLTCPQG